MRTLNRLLAAATTIVSNIWCGPAQASQPFFSGLGDLPGGIFNSSASDVSADGSVVVGTSANATGRLNCCRGGPSTVTLRNAFRWTEQRGMIALGTLSESSLATSSATAISADGSTVVGSSGVYSTRRPPLPPLPAVITTDAFRWRSGPGMVGLEAATNAANAVSENGRVVVGNSTSASGSEAFLWRQGSGMAGLGDFPGGAFASFAHGVSADGSVVVGGGNSDIGGEAFRWTQSAGMVGLGDLPGGAFASIANDVSADGSIVVGYGTTDAGNEAFRWTHASGMLGLGDLSGGTFASFANDVSADGSIVVGYGTTDLGGEAFVWDVNRGMRNLRDVLANQHGLAAKLNGWRLTTANGISADGQVIAGQGINPDGDTEAWLARLGPDRFLPGDYNSDGIVDAADYVVWRKGLGTKYTENNYNTWRAYFGQTAGNGAVEPLLAAVPEPTSIALFVITTLGAMTIALRATVRSNNRSHDIPPSYLFQLPRNFAIGQSIQTTKTTNQSLRPITTALCGGGSRDTPTIATTRSLRAVIGYNVVQCPTSAAPSPACYVSRNDDHALADFGSGVTGPGHRLLAYRPPTRHAFGFNRLER